MASDTSLSITSLIEELILKNYKTINKNIEDLLLSKKEHLRLLRALAVGDRKIFSTFNRAGLNNINGGIALNFLEQKGLIQLEFSREEPARTLNPKGKLKRELSRYRISHKVLFTHPFLRFWFYFVAPDSKMIEGGNYDNFFKNWLSSLYHSKTSLLV